MSRRGAILIAAALLVVAPTGCKGGAAALLMLFPELGPHKEARFDLRGRRVALVVSSSEQIAIRDPGVVLALEDRIAGLLREHTKGIDLVSIDAVRDFRLAHQREWGPDFMGRLGSHFRTDVVVEIRVDQWRLHQGPHGRHVFQGRSDGMCRVFDSTDGDVLWEESFLIRYPTGTVRLSEEIDAKRFRKDLIDHVAGVLAPQFYRHKPDTVF